MLLQILYTKQILIAWSESVVVLEKKLNDMSKQDYAHLPQGDVRRKGAFASILMGMNQDDV